MAFVFALSGLYPAAPMLDLAGAVEPVGLSEAGPGTTRASKSGALCVLLNEVF